MKIKTCLFLPMILAFSNCNQHKKKPAEVAVPQKDVLKTPDSSGNGGTSRAGETVVANAAKFKKFKGAWFDIEYPANFTAKGSEKSATSDGFDSGTFTSPDGKVQFYVYSPQWNGHPKDILIKKNEENQVDYSEETKGDLTVKRWVIEADNGRYRRAYEETTDYKSQTNKIFGMMYDPDVYKDQYQSDYLHFKKSLMQYAD